MNRAPRPPRAARLMLSLSVDPQDRRYLLDDLEEEFQGLALRKGRLAARRWYWSQALRSLPPSWSRRLRLARWRRRIHQHPPKGDPFMSTLWQEFRLAFRMLSRRPASSLILLLTLALGIGANASIFCVVNGVLLSPLPYRNPEQLVFVWDGLEWIGIPRAWVQPPEVEDLRRQTTLFEGFAALRVASRRLTGGQSPQQVQAGLASANLFKLLGTEAALGRTFLEGEDKEGAEGVVVLTHALWMSRYGGDEGVLGRQVHLDGEAKTVVGVLPPGFNFLVHSSLGTPRRADLWTPMQVDLAQVERGNHYVAALGRIRDGVTFEQARAELQAVGEAIDQAHYGNGGFTFVPVPLHGDLVEAVRPALWILLGAVGLVLLIAAANIATILLARAQQREREIAVRRALGAGRAQIVRQMLAESLLLSLWGGALGLGIAFWGVQALLSLAPQDLPRSEAVGLDWRVALFTLMVAAGTGLLCGMAAALQGSGTELTAALHSGERGGRGSRRNSRTRFLLVAAEVALSMMLLVGAGLLMHSFARVLEADPGFDPRNVLSFGIQLPEAQPEAFEELLDGLRGLPQVVAAGAAGSLPLSRNTSQSPVFLPGQIPRSDNPSAGPQVTSDWIRTTPGYFRTMGIPLLQGRDFDQRDRGDATAVAVIDSSLIPFLWPDGKALGRRIFTLGMERQVVGVVGHARLYEIYRDDRPQVYLPIAQSPTRSLAVALRTATDPLALADSVRAQVRAFDPNQPIFAMQSMDQLAASSLAERRFSLLLMSGFALAALLLAALGVYGVLSYAVTQRRGEIGIRMALGAERRRVVRMIVRQGLLPAAAGIATGLVGALALGGILSGQLYGVTPNDPLTYLLAPLLLLSVALSACYLPARRAASVDPIRALRTD